MLPKDVLIRVERLTMRFGGLVAVDDVSFDVRRSDITALIGPNGAGKTTCFNLLTRFIEPTAGLLHFEGRDITRLTADAVARLGLVRSFQISAVFAHLSVFENVRLALQRKRGHSFDWWRSDKVLRVHDARAHELLAEVGLQAWSKHAAGELPYGRKRALELATTLALEPRMLLLDEPMAGMGPEESARLVKTLLELKRDYTILLVEHDMEAVFALADRITVLVYGRVIATGLPAAIRANADVRQAYLGEQEAVVIDG